MRNDDVIVHGGVIVTTMTDFSCSTKNNFIRIGVVGDRSHKGKSSWSPVDSGMLMFVLNIHLIECYIMNPIGSLVINILCFYIYIGLLKMSGIYCRGWFLMFLCSNVHITCPVLDGYNVLTASTLERKIRFI